MFRFFNALMEFYRKKSFRVLIAIILSHSALLWADPTSLNVQADARRLAAHVRTLSSELGLRDYEHPQELAKSSTYIKQEFLKAGGRVSIQVFKVDEPHGTNHIYRGPYRNVTASYGPEKGPRIIVGAHYDTAGPLPGADDNASGVAGLLELGRLLKKSPPSMRTDLVAFSLEEPPYNRTPVTGSGHYAQTLKEQAVEVKAMLALEMIGYFSDQKKSQRYGIPFLRFLYSSEGNFIAVVGQWFDAGLTRQVTTAMRRQARLPVYRLQAPRFLPGVNFSDHNNFWTQGYPALMITDTAFLRNPYYHTKDDTAEKLDYERMARVVEGVFHAIQELSQEATHDRTR
jgi:hypothetical protein